MAQTRIPEPKVIFRIAAIILLAVGAAVILAAQRFIQDSEWVIRTTTILRELDDIATLERRAVAAQRGYLLTSEQALRDEFWEARVSVMQETTALRSSVRDAQAATEARELEPLIRRRVDLAARTLGLFEQRGLDTARRYIATNGSLQLDRRIRSALASIRARELHLLANRRAALDESASLVMLAAALGIPISLAMLALVNRALVRENSERRRAESEATVSALEYRQLSTDMASLTRFAGMLQSCGDVKELLAITAQGFSMFAPGLGGSVYLLRASLDHAEHAMQWGTHSVASDDMPAPGDCWALRRNQPYICEDVRAGIPCTHVTLAEGGETAATACLPLSAQGKLMGWLYLSRPGAGPIVEYPLVLQAAEQLSLALANVRLREDLRHQSIRDPLTGLYNRRYLEESLAREVARCSRRDLPLVVMMFDLDHFKSFNDVHGHPGGDALLSSFGRLLQSSCRPEDIPCRYGGEEFILILPETGIDTGVERAAAILDSTAKMIVAHQGVTLGRVTTSIGLASMPANGLTGLALVEASDKALYQAKAEGRNRFRIAAAALPPKTSEAG